MKIPLRPKKASRSLAGKRAYHQGEAFEDLFKTLCRKEKISFTRIPNGCRSVGKRIIRVKSPFDWILTCGGFSNPKMALIDTKTINRNSFPHSLIELHQVEEMIQHESSSIFAGYIIWLRPIDRVLFVSANYLLKCIGVKGGIQCTAQNMNSVIDLGSSLDCRMRDRLFHV